MSRAAIPATMIGLSLLVVAALAGCASPNYGSLKLSSEITELFESGRILPDHRYYYSGFAQIPDAIIAVDQAYSLRSRIWQYFEPTSATLSNWVYRIRATSGATPAGSLILGPDGGRIGAWYASLRQTAVRITDQNELVIAPPATPGLGGGP